MHYNRSRYYDPDAGALYQPGSNRARGRDKCVSISMRRIRWC
ncbi:hypothetical protein [Cronobacter dublinensis]